MNLDTYFTEIELVKLLCKYRASEANKRHKKHMIRNLSLHDKSNNIRVKDKEVDFKFLQSLFPGRRDWCHVSQHRRKELKDSIKINQQRLLNTYLCEKQNIEKNNGVAPFWYLNLKEFIRDIQSSIDVASSYEIETPNISGIKKEIKNDNIIYRPIAIYSLKDKIICSQTSKYLISYFDEIFLDCSYAFRSKKIGQPLPNHHDCITEIVKYRKGRKKIWVSECDIQKFFDTVQHKHALNTLMHLAKKVESNSGKILDEKAIRIFKLFLLSFNFQDNIYKLNGDIEWFRAAGLPPGKFSWVKDELNKEFGNDYTEQFAIGVPQGNSISCFIANLVMHSVDYEIKNNHPSIFYIRYCDDMILLSETEQDCTDALSIYLSQIKNSYLLYHTPKQVTDYNTSEGGRAFWKLKSKIPFCWDNKRLSQNNIPWVSFVGYQIDYNGKIRVRKASIRKEVKKQISETQKVVKYLGKFHHYTNVDNEHARLSKKQIHFSVHNKLISMSVGRIKIFDTNVTNPGLCWTNGFRVLPNNNITRKQMRFLDRKRHTQLKRLALELDSITKPHVERSDFNKSKFYFGKPFSYYNHIKNK